MVEAMEIQKGFKKTDAGTIPGAWQVPKLIEIADFENGKAHEQFIDDKGEYIVVNSKFISTEGNVRKFSNKNLSPLKKGSIAIVMSDIPNGRALAKCYLVEKDNRYTLNQRIGCIKPNEDIDYRYLFYKLNRNIYFLSFDSGSGQTNLRRNEILDCPVAIPPTKVEQTAIAEALNDADALIAELEKLIAKKKAIKQGAMQELLKPKAGWEVRLLGDFLDYEQPTKYVVADTEYNDHNQTPVLTAGKTFILGYTNEEFGVFNNHPVIIFDDFTTATKYIDFPFKVKSSAMKILKPKKDVNLRFVFELMQTIKFDSTDHKRYWISEYRNIEVKVPRPDEQDHISKILSDMDAEIEVLEKKLDKYKMLKQGLMQNLLTGKIRLI